MLVGQELVIELLQLVIHLPESKEQFLDLDKCVLCNLDNAMSNYFCHLLVEVVALNPVGNFNPAVIPAKSTTP